MKLLKSLWTAAMFTIFGLMLITISLAIAFIPFILMVIFDNWIFMAVWYFLYIIIWLTILDYNGKL